MGTINLKCCLRADNPASPRESWIPCASGEGLAGKRGRGCTAHGFPENLRLWGREEGWRQPGTGEPYRFPSCLLSSAHMVWRGFLSHTNKANSYLVIAILSSCSSLTQILIWELLERQIYLWHHPNSILLESYSERMQSTAEKAVGFSFWYPPKLCVFVCVRMCTFRVLYLCTNT